MKVSVLIPAFHAESFIVSALESVRAQTHRDWEIIVVEDGSHDRTEELVSRFATRVSQPVFYENLGRNCGVAAARNQLLELAGGEAIAFLDADDTWAPDHLASAVAELARGVDLVVSGVRTVDLADRRVLEDVAPPSALTADPVDTLFAESVIITSSAVVLRTSLVGAVGRFDSTLRIGEDRDYWLRAALVGARFGFTGRFTCNYSKHLSSSMARTHMVAEHIVRFYEKYESLPEIPRRVRRHRLAESLVCLGRLLRRDDRARSAACFWRAWRSEPLNPRIPLHLFLTGWRSMSAAPS